MGADCSHDKFEVVEEFGNYTEKLLWNFCSATIECKDCGKKSPAVQYTGRMTGYTGKWHLQNKKTCKHQKYFINGDYTIEKEQTLGGSIVRLFTGPSLDGIQYHSFLITNGQCAYCQKEMKFRCEFKHVWKNKQKVIEKTTDWKVIEQ